MSPPGRHAGCSARRTAPCPGAGVGRLRGGQRATLPALKPLLNTGKLESSAAKRWRRASRRPRGVRTGRGDSGGEAGEQSEGERDAARAAGARPPLTGAPCACAPECVLAGTGPAKFLLNVLLAPRRTLPNFSRSSDGRCQRPRRRGGRSALRPGAAAAPLTREAPAATAAPSPRHLQPRALLASAPARPPPKDSASSARVPERAAGVSGLLSKRAIILVLVFSKRRCEHDLGND
ncbi:uncharacterized protein V5649_009723 [Rhynchonycteris naso]